MEYTATGRYHEEYNTSGWRNRKGELSNPKPLRSMFEERELPKDKIFSQCSYNSPNLKTLWDGPVKTDRVQTSFRIELPVFFLFLHLKGNCSSNCKKPVSAA